MDFDDADGSSAPAPKPARFVPKSRFQLKSKPKPAAPSSAAASVQPKLEPSSDGGPPVSVKMEHDSDQPIDGANMDISGPSLTASNENGAKLQIDDGEAHMDVDAVEEEQNQEEEDYVVSEIDVYFNPSPIDEGNKLFVLQYPLRPSWRPYDLENHCKEVRVKPASADVEIDLSLDVASENYDSEAPSAPKLEKLMTLSTKWRPVPRTAYAIGVFTGRELHLNPVHAVRQLRPSMEYLNPNESKKKNVSEVATKAKSATAESSGNPNKAMDLKDDEPCIALKCHGSSSDLSARYRNKMLARVNSSLTFPMKPLEYLDSLCPQPAIDKTKPVAPSKRSLLLLPLDQRLRLLFAEGPPLHRFRALKHYAPDHELVDVLRALEQFALVVQGHWVAKTAIRYPNANKPFVVSRDYVLFLFSQSTSIKYSDLDGVKIPKQACKDALSELAIERPKCEDWKFKEPTDMIFIKGYPGIIEEFEKRWKAKGEQLQEMVRPKKNPTKAVAFGKLHQSQISDRSAGLSATGAHIETRTMSNEAHEPLLIALRKLFQANKVCSLQLISQGLRSVALNINKKKPDSVAKVAAFGLEAPQEKLLEVISEVAVNIHGAFVLKSSSEHPELNPLRNVVIDLFIGKGPNAKVKKSEIFEAAKIQLQKEPSNDEFRKVLSEFCESNGSAWVLKRGNGGPGTSSAK